MFRETILAVAVIGMLTSSAPSFAADLLGYEGPYDQSYYDGPYQQEYAIPAPPAGINRRTTLVPPAYAPPDSRWSCERPPYGTGDIRPLVEPYRGVSPPRSPSYWQPDYRHSYRAPSDGWGDRIPIPPEGIYDRPPRVPDTYARPGHRRSYDMYTNCGINRYWDGQRCVDAQAAPYYPSGRRL